MDSIHFKKDFNMKKKIFTSFIPLLFTVSKLYYTYRSFVINAHIWDRLGGLGDGQQYHNHVSDLHLHYHDV